MDLSGRAYQVDVTSYEAVASTTEAVIREFNGRLDIFVANSGIPWIQGAALDGELSHYHKVMSTDIDSAFYCARVAGLHWRRQKKEQTTIDGEKMEPAFREGSFIATASISGSIVNIPQLQAAYNAAKAAVIHLCKFHGLAFAGLSLRLNLGKSLAIEWVGFARANTVSPGYICTEILSFAETSLRDIWQDKTPMGREGQAHELKGAFLYLASDAASYTTGADIIIDGGYTLV